ncbi:MFS monosaccharide transporter [Rhizoctonia solani 123E]|uniref:MFS monosaccharide transporter n=1 Tax=Rhizoctonia solani 123E TaxID=1423351 RepID=A0A074SDT1_9AGAM|nr:MFS monosaccharide transporter [Rhizoctonia solani 123E]
MTMRSYTVLCAIFVSVGSYLFGYDSGVMTTTIAQDSFKAYFNHPSQSIIGALVSTYIAGEAIGACFAAWSCDALGRRHTIAIAAATATVGTVIQTASVHIGMLICGRIVTGMAVGCMILTVPVYNSEISPPQHRGLLVGMSGQLIGVGSLVANWIGYASSYAPESAKDFRWRFPLAMQIPPGLIVFAGIWFLPYSPRWLITQGRENEAYSALKLLMGSDDDSFEVEFNRMKEQIKLEKAKEVKSLFELWKRYRRRVLVSVAVQTCTSLSGVNVIGYYQTIIYASIGIRGKTILLLSGAYGTVGRSHCQLDFAVESRLLGTYTLIVLGSNRTRGRPYAGNALDQTLTRFYAGTENSVGQGFIIAFIFCYTFIFYLGFNSVTWTYGAEVLPVHIRSKGNALAAFSHFVFNIAVNQAAPTAFANIGYRFYALFIALNLCTAIIVWAYFPETKGLSLEEIAVLFGDEVVSESRLDPSTNSHRGHEATDLNPSKGVSTEHFEQVHRA